ncbi:MAG: TetR/AcrR family transcriptional regulator [Syntrophomonas sp.]
MEERIINRAQEEIERFGYRRFTMDDIAAGLGISKKTLYKYFASKGELITAVLQKELERQKNIIEAVVETNEHWFDRLNAAMSGYCDNMMPAHHINEIKHYFPEQQKEIENSERFCREQLGRLLQEGIQRGEIQPGLNVEMSLIIIQELLNFSVYNPTSNKDGMDAKQLLEEVKKIIFFGLVMRDW